MTPLHHILGYLSAVALIAMGTLAAIGLSVLTDSGEMVHRRRLNSTIQEADHLRTLNKQLSRQLERQQSERQLNQLKP